MAAQLVGITAVLIFTAYFVKGFTGFGPALILIPTLSLIFTPQHAIFLTTIFDLIAGSILLFSVRKQVQWKIVFLVLLAFFPGAYAGAHLMTALPIPVFKKVLGLFVLFFIGLILWQSTRAERRAPTRKSGYLQFLFSLLAGFGGGLVGISGPLLVIYFKLNYPKSFFRTQLIAVFAFGAAWRLFLYRSLGVTIHLTFWQWLVFLFTLLAAIATGSFIQLHVNEQKFDRIVALILLIPCFTLML